jgi:hypothetical protein
VTDRLTLLLEPYGDGVRDLVVLWREVPADAVPGTDGELVFSRWVEQPELQVVPADAAPPEGLVLARLTWTRRGRVDVDTSVRRPLGPA